MKKRIILLLLAMSMILVAFVGCKKDEEVTDDTVETVDTDIFADDEDTIGEYDFEGAEYTILTRTETKYEYASNKGLGGDVVERAAYKRNLEVEDRFNVKIKIVDRTGGWEQRATFLTAVRAEQMGGGGGYDLVSTHSVYLGWMTIEGLATDMSTLPEISFEKKWWNQNLYDEININGHVYFMLGDICSTTYEYMQVLFMNETKFNDFFVDDDIDANVIYDLVDKGEWTWDKLMEYSLAYEKTDGETVTDFGFGQNTHSWRASFMAQDAYLYTRDNNGDLMLPDAPTDKLIDIVDKMVEFYSKENIKFVFEWSTGASTLNPMFTAGNVLFYSQTLGEAQTFSTSMRDSYGVIPLPKYDTFQEQYYTICRDTVSAVMVMSTTDTPEMSGVITEALCMYGYKLITPEYYETVLKVRYFDDAKYGAILDQIRAGLTFQVVDCYVEDAPDCDMFHIEVVEGKKNEVVSTYMAHVTRGQNMLATFYAELKNKGLY